MKKKILILIGVFCFGLSQAQVGINTKNPQGIFHIDSKDNTVGATNFVDDILVDSQGNLGIGTLTPKSKVDVEGSLSIVNSGEGDQYILTSDNIGIGTWRDNPVTKVNKMSICKTSGNIPSVTNGLSIPLTSSFTFTTNELNLTATPNGGILLDKGLYLVIVDFDITNANEYGQIIIFRDDTGDYFLSNIYRDYMTGQSVSLAINTPIEITSVVALKNYPIDVTYFDKIPFYNLNYEMELKIIQLQ